MMRVISGGVDYLGGVSQGLRFGVQDILGLLVDVDTSSRDALEGFVSDHRLRGMSAARVANDGQVFYVLLLGIYETAAIANEAAEDIPPQLDKLSPWVRRLGSLQTAMIRADEIADSSSL